MCVYVSEYYRHWSDAGNVIDVVIVALVFAVAVVRSFFSLLLLFLLMFVIDVMFDTHFK